MTYACPHPSALRWMASINCVCPTTDFLPISVQPPINPLAFHICLKWGKWISIQLYGEYPHPAEACKYGHVQSCSLFSFFLGGGGSDMHPTNHWSILKLYPAQTRNNTGTKQAKPDIFFVLWYFGEGSNAISKCQITPKFDEMISYYNYFSVDTQVMVTPGTTWTTPEANKRFLNHYYYNIHEHNSIHFQHLACAVVVNMASHQRGMWHSWGR